MLTKDGLGCKFLRCGPSMVTGDFILFLSIRGFYALWKVWDFPWFLRLWKVTKVKVWDFRMYWKMEILDSWWINWKFKRNV